MGWMKAIAESIGQADVFEFYHLDVTIGQGQFGQVKLGVHKKTGQKVAIKIMTKRDIKSIEV